MGDFWRRFRDKKSYILVAAVALLIGVVVTVGCMAAHKAVAEQMDEDRGQVQAAPLTKTPGVSSTRLPGGDPDTIADMVDQVGPAVVMINTTVVEKVRNGPVF